MDINLVAAAATAAERAAPTAAAEAASVPTITTTNYATNATISSKTLKRCLSVPIIHTLPLPEGRGSSATTKMTTRSAAAAGRITKTDMMPVAMGVANAAHETLQETPKKHQNHIPDSSCTGSGRIGHNIAIGVPRSNPCSREVSPAPMFNIFAPRARRYSASSYCPLGAVVASGSAGAATSAPLCLTPRVSQLRQEECVDMNSREVNHEREVHSAMQMSQSWEDLTLVAENWSCKSDEFSNPLQVVLPSGVSSCSSPSPTSNRAGLRLPYGSSPSPTRRTFATRRSMSPIAMRPSQLGPVKRKFVLDDNNSSNWNVYSPPPLKKIFTESRGSSPVCQSPSSVCPSPDSGTYDGRITPKLLISKLCTTNTINNNNNHSNNSACSSPMSASPSGSIVGMGGGAVALDSAAASTLCSSSSSSSASSVCGGSEPMCIGHNIDEGISISEVDEKQHCSANTAAIALNAPQPMATDIQDEATLMDDMKSETSSIGGCSSISIESSSCDSGAKAAASFLNKLNVDDMGVSSSSSSSTVSTLLGQKNFFINKQGLSGPKKFVVNHDHLPNSSTSNIEPLLDSISVSSTSTATASSSIIKGAGTSGGGARPMTAASVIVENTL